MARRLSNTEKDCQALGDVAVLERNTAEKAKDIAECGIITINSQESVYKAIEIMVEKNISGLPVVDETDLVGVISEKDVLKLLYATEFVAGRVEEYMTGSIISFDEEDRLADICDCLIKNDFRRVPILHEGMLTGVISRTDLIRAAKDKFKPQGVDETSTQKRRNIVLTRDVMKCGLLTVQRETPIYEAMDIIATRNITGLPVVDDCMNLVGVVSERDMLKLLYDPTVKAGKTEEFMTEEVVSFNHDDELSDVCDCLINNRFRRVPILNQGKVVGIISRADVILYILKHKLGFSRHRRAE
jgi:CBS domain-containing protein